MNARLTLTSLLAALACTAALAGTARAEEGGGDIPDDVVITLPDETGEPGSEEPWEGQISEPPEHADDGDTSGDGGDGGEPVEYVEDGGDPVGYGPDDCIDCNVVTTTDFSGEGRGGAENQRGSLADGGNRAMARDSGGSGRPACGSLRPHDMRPCDK